MDHRRPRRRRRPAGSWLVRRRLGARPGRGDSRPDHPLELGADRGPGEPHQNAQAADVRPRQPAAAAQTRPAHRQQAMTTGQKTRRRRQVRAWPVDADWPGLTQGGLSRDGEIPTGAVKMEEQPGFVVEGERVALGPLRSDLVPTYQRWENDLEVANGNGRVMPFTLEAERDRVAGRSGRPDCLDFTVYDRADQTPIGWSTLAGIDHRK